MKGPQAIVWPMDSAMVAGGASPCCPKNFSHGAERHPESTAVGHAAVSAGLRRKDSAAMVLRMQVHDADRRLVLRAGLLAPATLLGACGTPLPLTLPPGSSPAAAAAQARLMDSAQAHGLDAYRQLTDISVAFTGPWRPLINRIQPEVVDRAYRGNSEERLLPALGTVAQSWRGSDDARLRKHVFWQRPDATAARPGELGLWYDGRTNTDTARATASALVAECCGLFLLGPLWLVGRCMPIEVSGTERVDGRLCDAVQVWLRPGLGYSLQDRVTVLVDRDGHLTRRLRFTLEGFAGTQGAVAEVDWLDYSRRFGVLWPTRFYEEVVHPLRLPAHDWALSGLSVNRGFGLADLRGPSLSGAAAAPAAPL